MLTLSDVDKATYVVRASGAAEQFDAIRNEGKKKSGRTSGLRSETLLIGMVLAAMSGKGMVKTDIYTILTEDVPFDRQLELGVRLPGTPGFAFSIDSIDRVLGSFLGAVEYGRGSAPHLDEDTRQLRHHRLLTMLNSMLDQTLVSTASPYLALDSTGLWSFGRNPGKTGVAALTEEIKELRDAGQEDDAQTLQYYLDRMLEEEKSKGRRAKKDSETGEFRLPARGYDPDARSSGKTGKNGKTEWYYGYELHAMNRTAAPGSPYAEEPNLVVRFDVTPAGRDVIKTSVGLLDMLPETEPVTHIIADRLYSNLLEENWYLPLVERGLKQVVDMRESDQAWTYVEGMRVTAGWCHCPATPDRFQYIAKPSIGVSQEFCDAIDERFAYACQLVEDTGTRRRFRCPARAGKVRCELYPPSLASGHDLPLIENPPAAATAPKICTQTSVAVRASNPTARARLWQPKYWGSKEQLAQWFRRTAIEQLFGKRKDRHGTHMTRGFVRTPGLAAFTLAVGMVLIAGNILDLEVWVANDHHDGRDSEHPLLQPGDPLVVFHVPVEMADRVHAFLAGLEDAA